MTISAIYPSGGSDCNGRVGASGFGTGGFAQKAQGIRLRLLRRSHHRLDAIDVALPDRTGGISGDALRQPQPAAAGAPRVVRGLQRAAFFGRIQPGKIHHLDGIFVNATPPSCNTPYPMSATTPSTTTHLMALR